MSLDGLSAWMAERAVESPPPATLELIQGGKSNLTFLLTDGEGARLILRRPPLGKLLDSAHDMVREFRILSGLAESEVPVPEAKALCTDPDVIGAPFYLMEFVDGILLRDQMDVIRHFEPHERKAIGQNMIEVLACLHNTDPRSVGLGELGPPDGYVPRQLRRWHRQWMATKTQECGDMDRAHTLLESMVPAAQRRALVHGDYRLDNLILNGDETVAAVLDWELCTLGDPLADLGMLMVVWLQAGEDPRHLIIGTPSALPGFVSRRTLLEEYEAHTGLDLEDISYYTALAYWKVACITEGVFARQRDEARAFSQHHPVPKLAARAVALLERRAENY